jgi:glycosyltransferase involved in cell wall biosynthesis
VHRSCQASERAGILASSTDAGDRRTSCKRDVSFSRSLSAESEASGIVARTLPAGTNAASGTVRQSIRNNLEIFDRMKIAQVAPLMESIPPKFYGGTERVVSYLTEELVRQGHEVTLFASGDSQTAAILHATVPAALRLNPAIQDPLAYQILQLEEVRRRAHEFDVVHFHSEYLHLPLIRALGLTNAVTTMHGRLDLPDYRPLFAEFCDAPLVSISASQRTPLGQCHWVGTVHHGLPDSVCRFRPVARGDYVAFIGRISPEKRADRAIEIARRAGVRLKIAAKIDSVDRVYFQESIAGLIRGPHVEFVGEIGENDKEDFLGDARALLFPIDWPEPFGLVMIEAMSCGTPCVAWREGSVPEIISEGRNGFIVDSLDDAVAAVHHSARLDRAVVRSCFEKAFTAERMTRDYLEIYRALIARGTNRAAA